MRKLKLQMNITIDGFVADSNSKLDWMLPETDQKQINFLNKLTEQVDTILLGRTMATESIPHWEKISKSGKEDQETTYAKFFTDTHKIVFSKTLKKTEGQNISLENGDLNDAIKQLKQQPGKDIIVYGGAKFSASLVEQNLIDELNLFVHPVSLGKGLSLFNKASKFNLVHAEPYENGILRYTFEPA